jgi:hypothetical protein
LNSDVCKDYLANPVDQCTEFEQSCDKYEMVPYLSSDQKQVIKCLYKNGRKIVISESHIEFLSKSLEDKFIPRSFQIKTNIPGNKDKNQERLNKASFEAIKEEKERHLNILRGANKEFQKNKDLIKRTI